MKVNSVRKILSKTDRAYLAGLIDGDGAIMACIERHREKKFGFRVRLFLKVSQNDRKVLDWCRFVTQLGGIRTNRTQYEWEIRDQKAIKNLLAILSPYLKVKQKQAKLAIKILESKINKFSDLIKVARLADKLSQLNIRSNGRRKNFATII